MTDQTIRIGRVIGMSGSGMTGLMTGDAGAPEVHVGMLIKAAANGATVFGIVSSLTAEAAPGGAAADAAAGSGERRIFEIDLMGEAVEARAEPAAPGKAAADGGGDGDGDDGGAPRFFRRGVSVYPSLGADIRAADGGDYALVYRKPDAEAVRLGTVYHSDGLPAHVMIDDLLSKHFAILGTTGTGKSCTVALILRRILARHPFGHVILLDPHNEYASAFGAEAALLNTDSLELPYWLFNGEEMASIVIGRERTQDDRRVPILNAAILAAKREFLGRHGDDTHLTVDTPSPYRLSAVVRALDDSMGRLEKPEGSLPYLQLKSRIETLGKDVRYAFMFNLSGLVVRDVMTDIVSQLLRVPVDGKPITIIDLSAVPSEITDTVVSVLARLVFDFCLWAEPIQALPILLVCEEAHRYIPHGDGTGFEPSKRVLSRIAKEGRKYGVALGLVSQRPSELSASILSQCSTLFALRMGNELDQQFVFNALPENASGFLTALSSLRTQEAIAVGEGLTVPMRLMFDDLEPQHMPRSGNADFSQAWRRDDFSRERVAQIVDRWRRQMRSTESPRPVFDPLPDPLAAPEAGPAPAARAAAPAPAAAKPAISILKDPAPATPPSILKEPAG